MAKMRRSNDLIGSLSADLSQIKVEDGSVLVLRSDRDWKEAEMQRLQEEVNQSLPPDANCLLLVVRTDEAFETIPEPAARSIYTELKKMFEPDGMSLAAVEDHVISALADTPEVDTEEVQKAFDSLKKKAPTDGGVDKN